MRHNRLFFSAIGLPLALCCSSAAVFAQSDAGTPPVAGSSTQDEPIPQTLTLVPPKIGAGILKTDQAGYRPGQPVGIAFTISNVSKKTVPYDYPTNQQFDVTVKDAQGDTVWDWARGRTFAPQITSISLKPGQKRTYRVVWNGRGARGRPVLPGIYTINAWMTSSDRPAITGNLVVNTDTDPENMGLPTRSPSDNGAIREVYLTPPITATTTVPIGVSVSPHK